MLLPHQPGSKTFIDNMAAVLALDLEKIVIWQRSPGGCDSNPFPALGVCGTDAFEWREPPIHGTVSVSWGNVRGAKSVMSFFKRKGEDVNGAKTASERGRDNPAEDEEEGGGGEWSRIRCSQRGGDRCGGWSTGRRGVCGRCSLQLTRLA